MTRLRPLLAALIIAQFAWSGSAHATPGCMPSGTPTSPYANPASGAAKGGSSDAATTAIATPGSAGAATGCQWRYENSGTENDSGNIYGSNTAPPPSADCTAAPCSDGIRQDHGVTNILYNNFFNGATASTTTTCRFVDNDSSNDLFVPQNTLTEFSDFISSSIANTKGDLQLAYCAQGTGENYVATATYPNGYMLWNGSELPTSVTLPASPQAVTQNASLLLPTTRVNNPAPANGYPVQLTYSRQDCAKNAGGAVLCNSRVIVETQTIEYTMSPNPNTPLSQCQNPAAYTIDCDWVWNPPTIISDSCTVDGVSYGNPAIALDTVSCLADYDPPSCGGTTSAPGAPITQACPAGTTGTQTCQTIVTSTYGCSGGVPVLTGTAGTGVPVPISCVGLCTPCATSAFGDTCTASAPDLAHAFFYTLPKLSIPADWAATNGAYDMNGVALKYLTTEDQIFGLQFYVDQLDIPLEDYTVGFPGFSNLTSWFGVCYDAGYVAPTAGTYTFISAANNGMTLRIDGAPILDNEGSDSAAAPDPMLGASVNLTAGLHDVEIQIWQGWAPGLGFQLWALTPGDAVNPAWLEDETFDADSLVGPPESEIMTLVGAPKGALNCEHSVVENAQCGAEWTNASSFSMPMTDLCGIGSPTVVTADDTDGTWDWTCNGLGGAASASCSVTAAVCGVANGTFVTATPKKGDLCIAFEKPSPVKDDLATGTWTWTCASGGGVTIGCSATVPPPPPPPTGSGPGTTPPIITGGGGGGGSGGGGGGGGGPKPPPPPESF